MKTDYLDALAQFAVGFRLADVPVDVAMAGRNHILDTLGVIVGASKVEQVRNVARRRSRTAHSAVCTALGMGLRLDLADAALVHGTAGTWFDFDLGHRWSGGHPSIHVLAAALATAEARGLAGSDLLAAFIVGCEIACRIGVSIGKLAPGLHPHGSWPVLGAVAAVGRLSGSDAAAIRRALDLVSTLTLVTSWRTAFSGADIRNLYAGLGAQLAIRAIDLERAGWIGEHDGVGVVFGSIATSSINRRRSVVELGTRWEFATSYYKPYAFARFGQAVIDILLNLRSRMAFDADDVESIDVATYRLGALMNAVSPASELAARFSVPQAVGALLVRGRCGPDEFRGQSLHDPAIRSVAQRVRVSEDPDWENLNPGWRGATVTVRLHDGRIIRAEAEQTRGDPELPFSEPELDAKFESLVAPIVGQGNSRAARDTVRDIESLDDVRGLTRLLAAEQTS